MTSPLLAEPYATGQILSFRQSLTAMLGMCCVVIMVAVDQTVVGTALPTVIAELKGFHFYAWIATAYLLTSIITVPIFGRLGDYYGRKPFVVASIITFTLASALCGAAHSMLFLVLARALQGIGGGMLVGTAFACIPDLFPDPYIRLRWQMMFSAAFGIATAVGPFLGGFLTEYYGWRPVFYVNVPIGLLGLWCVIRYLPYMRQMREATIRLDWLGALLIALALGGLQLFLELGAQPGYHSTTLIWAAISTSAFIALYHWERHCPHPLLPVELFRNTKLRLLLLLILLAGMCMLSLLFYAPLLLQGGFGLSPQEAGLLITPMVVFITVGSIANSYLIARIKNPTRLLQLGFLFLCGAMLGVTSISHTTPHGYIAFYLLIAGGGLGLVLPNITVFIQEMAGHAHLGIATALLQSLRMIGGMLGIAVMGTIVSHHYVTNVHAALVKHHALRWLLDLRDPQLLTNLLEQAHFLQHIAALGGGNGTTLLETARVALVTAIHTGDIVILVISVLALWLVRRVPPIQLKKPAALQEE